MMPLAETDLQIDYCPGPKAVVPDTLSQSPDYSYCEGNLFLHMILTLEVPFSTLIVKPSFLHYLSSKQFNSADHEIASFVDLARASGVHFLIESRFGVDLVVHHLFGKAKQLVLPNGSRFRQICMDQLRYTAQGGQLGVCMLYYALEQRLWWPTMCLTISSFVAGCSTCQHIKDSTQCTPGLLQTLPIPSHHFESW